MKKEIYSFQYCSCIYESAFATISLHQTKKGAYKAMRNYIEKDYAKWRNDGCRYGKQHFKHGVHEDCGFGGQEVADDLIIVGENWWLERYKYDGSEWWEFKQLPKEPETKVTLYRVVGNGMLSNLKEMKAY